MPCETDNGEVLVSDAAERGSFSMSAGFYGRVAVSGTNARCDVGGLSPLLLGDTTPARVVIIVHTYVLSLLTVIMQR